MIVKIICPFCGAIIAEESVLRPSERATSLNGRDMMSVALAHGKAAGCGNSGAFSLSISEPPAEPVIPTVEEAERVSESS